MAPKEEVEANGEGVAPQNNIAEMAQAFRELAKGESTATAMESKLTTLESRLDELLAMVGEDTAAFSKPEDKTVNGKGKKT